MAGEGAGGKWGTGGGVIVRRSSKAASVLPSALPVQILRDGGKKEEKAVLLFLCNPSRLPRPCASLLPAPGPPISRGSESAASVAAF